jgi:hypothetical protein
LEHGNRLWDALDQTDAVPTTPDAAAPAPELTVARTWFGGARRGIATALLATGLLLVGGVAAVSAADPSASPAPSATDQPSDPGTSAQPVTPANPAVPAPSQNADHPRGDCPNDGSGDGSDGSGGSNTTPDASPDASGL